MWGIMKKVIKYIQNGLLSIVQGILVGFGAIMPGISGGTLLVAFGMYRPIIEVISNPFKNLKKHFKALLFFGLGGVIGFVGLSGFANWLMEISSVLVTCTFIGFIIGTYPELLSDAKKEGRNKKSYISVVIGFIFMIFLLNLIANSKAISIKADLFGYILCGLIWGLSFIVPGLSSSTLLLFFGLYQPMLDGISKLDLTVIVPIGIGALLTVASFSKLINFIFKKFYNIISHFIIGAVTATLVMIIPDFTSNATDIITRMLCIVVGAITSFYLTKICDNIKKKNQVQE